MRSFVSLAIDMYVRYVAICAEMNTAVDSEAVPYQGVEQQLESAVCGRPLVNGPFESSRRRYLRQDDC